jgi:hypothetical protein
MTGLSLPMVKQDAERQERSDVARFEKQLDGSKQSQNQGIPFVCQARKTYNFVFGNIPNIDIGQT